MKVVALIATGALLAGCGGGGSGGSKNELAANACDAFAKTKLEDKTYTLDHAALARLHQAYLDCGLTDRDDAIEMRTKEPDWAFLPVRY